MLIKTEKFVWENSFNEFACNINYRFVKQYCKSQLLSPVDLTLGYLIYSFILPQLSRSKFH